MAGIIGSALGAVGSIFGGITASKAMRQVSKDLKSRREENKNWFDRRYNEDATQRGAAQRILTQTMDTIRSSNRASAGRQAVMGGTDAAAAAARETNAGALADATAKLAAGADARKDAIENKYRSTDASLRDALNNTRVQQADAIATAVKGVTDTAQKLPY